MKLPSVEKSNNPAIVAVDPLTFVVYLEIPTSKVVLFQAYFELYEGIGVVRTVDVSRSLICVITPRDQLDPCLSALDSLRESVGWRFVDSKLID